MQRPARYSDQGARPESCQRWWVCARLLGGLLQTVLCGGFWMTAGVAAVCACWGFFAVLYVHVYVLARASARRMS